jgi:hypothetical protein
MRPFQRALRGRLAGVQRVADDGLRRQLSAAGAICGARRAGSQHSHVVCGFAFNYINAPDNDDDATSTQF